MFRRLRIIFLLFVLFLVVVSTYLTQLRTTAWDKPLTVAIYPVNGDDSSTSEKYIDSISAETFADIETFFSEEVEGFGLSLTEPVDIVLGPELKELPPQPPRDRNIAGVMLWSLKMRYWAWSIVRDNGPPSDIQIFVLYHDPKESPRLAHSLGLQKGLLGVVNAFASDQQQGSNNMVIAHEFLHTVGATDKYDMATLQPLYPDGYADPDKTPLLPQNYAEIMAGRIPVSNRQAEQPDSLDKVVVGEKTAREIHWIN